MGFFEDELRKMFGKNSPISDARFVGRACIGRLGETTNVKLEFVTMGTFERYEGLKAAIFNRNDGPIDSNTFRFADTLGHKVSGDRNGKMPYVWKYGVYEWYGYKPDTSDYAAVAKEVNSYLEMFLEPRELSRGKDQAGKASVRDAIRDHKPPPRQPRAKTGSKSKKGPEL